MPFIKQHVRDLLAKGCEPKEPGDYCYRWYKMMVDKWKENPRWTTAHSLYTIVRQKEVSYTEQVAKELAWQVFFQLYVMPYELEKRKENGDI